MDPEFIIMLIAIFFAYYLSATFGFGDALILLPILSIFIDIEIAVIFTGFWAFPQAIQQVIKYRNYLEKQFLVYFLPSIIPGIFLGILLILYIPSIWIQLLIGILILVYVFYKFFKILRNHKNQTPSDQNISSVIDEENKERSISQESLEEKRHEGFVSLPKSSLIVGGFLYGTVSSWVGTPGPISIMYLDISGFAREKFIANSTAIIVIAGIFKLSLYLINDLFPTENVWLFFWGLILCIIATKLGHITTPKIPVDKFQLILLIILFGVGIRMIYVSFIQFF